ncbi:MAG TPA: hypothetical protein VII63_08860 [Caulobacteraceae bacterium]
MTVLANPWSASVGKLVAASVLVFGLAACAGTERPRFPMTAARPSLPAQSGPSERLAFAIALLRGGQAAAARAQLMTVLSTRPGDSTARLLVAEIDGDPKSMLGERSHPYTARSGETMEGLSARFLGDRRLFYALARYNGIAVPDQPLAGRVLMIPGGANAPAPARVIHARREKPGPSTSPSPGGVSTATAPAFARNPAAASHLRGLALENMSSGRIDLAVALLRKAEAMDPGNPLIVRDLERATRVQLAVRERR